MAPNDDRLHRRLAERLPIVVGRDLEGMIETVGLYLGAIEAPEVVEGVARILVDAAAKLETPFLGQVWVSWPLGERTTVTYFQVIQHGDTAVVLAPIAKHNVKQVDYCGLCIPLRSQFIRGGPLVVGLRRARSKASLGSAWALKPWGGVPNFWSAHV